MELTTGLDSQLLLGRYRVVARLAEGGMGKVYLARVEGAEGFTKPVVVKVMRSDMRSIEDGNRLFSREALILSKMQHPAVPSIIDFGTQDGARIMVLDYVHGYSAANWLDFRFARHRQIPVDLCVFVVRRVLDALHYAHTFETAGEGPVEIVHRDVAADNVLLDRKGYVYLLDFGIASITGKDRRVTAEAGTFRGKLGYAAPETVEGSRATPRSDQYSAGVLLLELLTLEAPFQSDTVAETVLRMVQEEPPPASKFRSDVPKELDRILARVLRKNPQERFVSVLDLSRELRRVQHVDDEEALQELRRTLVVDFDALPEALGVESLKVREAALARIFEVTDLQRSANNPGDPLPLQLTPPSLHPPAPTEPVTRPDLARADLLRSESTLPPGAAQDRSKLGLLGILAISGVAIAIALGVLIALLTRGEEDQVVVVGGERGPTQVPGRDQEESPPPAAPEEVGKAEGAGTQELNRALQTQSPAFERCFVDNLDSAEKAPEVVLHFTIPRGGGPSDVSVEPKPIAATPLGACLTQAGQGVRFPTLEQGVSFRVPVRARFTRGQ